MLLGLDASLALVVRELGGALEGLVGGEILLLTGGRILTDLLVDGFVKFLKTIAFDLGIDVLGEVLLVLLVIFLLEVLHVFGDVSSEDAFAVRIGIVFLGITVVSRESLLGVRNVQTTISGSLEGSKNAVSSGSGLAANIQKGTEGSLVVIDFLHVVGLVVVFGLDNFGIDLGVSLVDLIESKLLKETTGAKKTGAISSGVVFQTNGKSVTSELGGLSLAENAISIDQGVRDLADNLGVGETNDESVLGRLVLVLGLSTQSLTLTVVSLSFASASELDLVPREVGLGLSFLNERLELRKGNAISLAR